jgi:hypothetical protein
MEVPLRSIVFLALITSAYGATPEIEIELAHGSAREVQTRDQLRRLLSQYVFAGWTWTRKVVIDEDAIPHSHPVLTLHARHLKQDLELLSTFVHEEYHWYETAHPKEAAAAITDFKVTYPKIAVGGQDGAGDEESSYLHIIVCYAEWQKMKRLVGEERAREVMEFWVGDHYRAIYKLVIANEAEVGAVVQRHHLWPPIE